MNPRYQVEPRPGGYYGITGDAEVTPSRATAEKWARLANAEDRASQARRAAGGPFAQFRLTGTPVLAR